MKDFIPIDRIVSAEPLRLSASKGFCGRETYFEAHLPGNPVVPGVYLLEGLSECVRWIVELRSGFTRTIALRGVDQAKFTRPVRPGEVIALSVRRESGDDRLESYLGEGRVGDSPAAAARLFAESVAVSDPAYAAHRRDALRFLLAGSAEGDP
jgi:3-hydroxyacyl-[acyl-carrier-protein] dehydratase